MNLSFLSQKGAVLLEYSFAAVFTLPLILMAVDAANLLKMRSALRESVNKTMRCLTPLESDCHAQTSDKYKAKYEVEINPAKDAWPLELFKFTGHTEWLGLPVTLYDDPQVTTLKEVTYHQRFVRASYQKPSYIVNHNLNFYVKRAHMPFIDTGTQALTTLSPQFVYKNTRSNNYKHALSVSLGHIDGRVRRQTLNGEDFIKKIGEASFTIPLKKNINCFRSSKINQMTTSQSKHKAVFSSTCNTTKLPVVIHVTGTFPTDIDAEGSQGTVYMKLKGADFSINGANKGTGEFNLGGRTFEYRDSADIFANFVPRGAPSEYYLRDNGYLEFQKYKNIRLAAGKTYTIEFYLQKRSKQAYRTRWKGKNLRVFLPKFVEVNENVTCKPENIIMVNGQPECNSLTFQSQNVPNKLLTDPYVQTSYQYIPLGCFATEQEAKAPCDNCIVNTNEQDTSCQQTRVITESCPENYGVSGNPNDDSKDEAQQICPINDPRWHQGLAVTYAEKSFLYGKDAQTMHTKTNCQTPDALPDEDIPADLKQYKKIKWNTISKLEDQKLYTGDLSLTDFKEQNPEYDCQDISENSKAYQYHSMDPDDVPERIKDSYLWGSWSLLNTGCDWEESVKSNVIEKLELNPEIYFKAQRTYAGLNYTDYKPSDSCYKFLPKKVKADHQAGIKIGPISYDDIPEECNRADKYCDINLIAYEKEGQGDQEIDLTLAKEQGYQTIKAIHPNAKKYCQDESNCYDMDIQFDGQDFQVEASMEVPLLTLMNKKQVRLSSKQTARWEGTLLE